jgi:integrase
MKFEKGNKAAKGGKRNPPGGGLSREHGHWTEEHEARDSDGRPQDRKTTWRAFDAAIKKANENAREDQKLRRLTVHSLRHSFASIHLMNGTPIPEVSSMLGHANVNITLTVYSHFIPKMQTDSSSRLAAVIFSGNKPDDDQVNHLKTARTI